MGSSRRDRMVMVAATADRSPLERVRGALGRDRDRRVLPRPRQERAARHRLADPVRDGAARARPRARRAAGDEGLSAERVRDAAAPARARRAARRWRRDHRRSTPCSSRATTCRDPVADSARSLLDAHIVLSRDLAGRGHFPAVDVLAAPRASPAGSPGAATLQLASQARASMLARRRQAQELQALGAYTAGANPALDHALAIGERIDAWARQTPARTRRPTSHRCAASPPRSERSSCMTINPRVVRAVRDAAHAAARCSPPPRTARPTAKRDRRGRARRRAGAAALEDTLDEADGHARPRVDATSTRSITSPAMVACQREAIADATAPRAGDRSCANLADGAAARADPPAAHRREARRARQEHRAHARPAPSSARSDDLVTARTR